MGRCRRSWFDGMWNNWSFNLGSSGTILHLEIVKIADSPISDLPDLSRFLPLKQLTLPFSFLF